MRAHRAHRSTRPAPVATPQPQKQWPLSAPPLPSSPPAPRSPGTSSIAPARAFPGRERVGSGNVSSSDARAARCRDRSSSRAAAPHARATSRLTAPSPSPAPPSTANSPPRPRTRLASPSACARRYVRPALERHPRPDGSFSISRRASSRRASSRDRGDARRHPASIASIALCTCASLGPLTSAPRSRPPQDEAAPAEKAPEEKKPEPIGPPRGSQVRLSPRRALVSFADPPLVVDDARTETPRCRIPEQTTRRRSGASSIARTLPEASKAPAGRAPRARDPADVRPSVPEQRTLEKSHSRNRVSGRSRRGGRRK